MAVSENDLVVGPLTPAEGVTTISLDFYFEQAAWLEVYKSGSETPLVLDTDYTVTGEGTSSGVVTLTTPANGDDAYSVYLVVPLERSSDMQLRGEFKSKPFNIELDRVWQAMQGIDTRLGRTLRVSRTSNVPTPLFSDTAAERSDRVLKFSGDGSGLEVGPTETQVENAQGYANEAKAARDKAQKWAENPEDDEVEPGEYSALHYAAKADASQTAAGDSADAAATSEQNASTSETNAANSASAASTSETNAAGSASAAATSEGNAAGSASAAATSESNAADSEAAAAASEAGALNAQSAAETARDQTLDAFDNFDDRYLGAKASDPTLDNDSNPLVAGALYWNTTAEEMRVYTGSIWVAAYVSGQGFLVANQNLSDLDNVPTARSNLGLVKQSSPIDTTSGRIMSVGAFGLGETNLLILPDLDDATTPVGFYRLDGTTLNAASRPAGVGGTAAVQIYRQAGSYTVQVLMSVQNIETPYIRSAQGGVWGPWRRMVTSPEAMATGDLLYFDGTSFQNLGIGTAGQVLRTNATADAPEWVDDPHSVTTVDVSTFGPTDPVYVDIPAGATEFRMILSDLFCPDDLRIGFGSGAVDGANVFGVRHTDAAFRTADLQGGFGGNVRDGTQYSKAFGAETVVARVDFLNTRNGKWQSSASFKRDNNNAFYGTGWVLDTAEWMCFTGADGSNGDDSIGAILANKPTSGNIVIEVVR